VTEQIAKTHMKEASISAVVIRKDGTVEDLGVIASTRPGNRFQRFWRRLRHGDK
jgi:hypothetical protein